MHKITTCASHLTHQDSWISWQVLWCLYLYRFFFEPVWFRCHVFLITAVCTCIQHSHTYTLTHVLSAVCALSLVHRNKAIQRLHSPSESCITSIIMLYQTFHHLLSDAQHLHPWCIKWWIILCATYYPRSTGIHIYICISNERVIINISKFIFIPMLAQHW